MLASKNLGRVQPKGNPVQVLSNNKPNLIKLKLSQPIYLINWPYKGTSRNNKVKSDKNIDILIESTETYSINDSSLIDSIVHVNYLSRVANTNEVELLESVHYDFIHPSASHPLFHAQICDDLIPIDSMNPPFKYSLRNDLKNRFKHFRIPTAHMNLPSVLLSMIADHSPPDSSDLKDFISAIKNISDLPNPNFANFNLEIKNNKFGFNSLYWYPVNKGRAN